jgi:hypothetical protein
MFDENEIHLGAETLVYRTLAETIRAQTDRVDVVACQSIWRTVLRGWSGGVSEVLR